MQDEYNSASERQRELQEQLKKFLPQREKYEKISRPNTDWRIKYMSEVKQSQQMVNEDEDNHDRTVKDFEWEPQAEIKQTQRDTRAALNLKARQWYGAKNQTMKVDSSGVPDQKDKAYKSFVYQRPSLLEQTFSKPPSKRVSNQKGKAEEAQQNQEPTRLQLSLQEIQKYKGSKQVSQKSKKDKKRQHTINQLQRFLNLGNDKQLSIEDSDIESQEPIKKVVSEPKGMVSYKQQNVGSEKKLGQNGMKPSLGNYNDQDSDPFQQEKSLPKDKDVILKPLKHKQPKVQKKRQTKTKTKSPLKYPINEPTAPLKGEVIAINGGFSDFDKDDFIEIIKQLGGSYAKSLVKKCTTLIQGVYCVDRLKKATTQPVNENAVSREALQRNITIVPYKQIDKYLLEKTRFDLAHYILEQRERRMTMKRETASNQQPLIKPAQVDSSNISPSMTWVEKYRPQSLGDVVGQTNHIRSLREWLESWEDIQVRGNKREVKDVKGWNAAGSINSKAALISGDSGIGKTATARLLAMEYDFNIFEFNTSDALNDIGVNMMQSSSLEVTLSNHATKSLMIMDEIDSIIAVNGGGTTAFINMIKNTNIPIICTCNNRSNQTIRYLAAHCLDIKFDKPSKNLVAKRLKNILAAEGGSGEQRTLGRLVESFQNDVRLAISQLQLIFRTVTKQITFASIRSRIERTKDESVMGDFFKASRKLLNRSQFSRMTISERAECFFIDSDIMPLMVHQNMLASAKKTSLSVEQFHEFVKGIHGMVVEDLIDKVIRQEQDWERMPSYAFMSCVYSPQKVSQAIGFQNFPQWLDKNSTERKIKRLAGQFKNYIYPTTFCSNWQTVKSLYAPLIMKKLVELLNWEDVEGACFLMQQYHLKPQALYKHLRNMQFNSYKVNPLSSVDAATKTKLTILFNGKHNNVKPNKIRPVKMKNKQMKLNPVLLQGEDMVAQEEQQQAAQNTQKKVSNKGKQKK